MEKLRGNVLVVEDDDDSGAMALSILARAGYGVRWVKSRDAALDAMQRNLYELILLDYAMPGLSIEEFLKVCTTQTHKIVLISAVVDPEKQARQLGLKFWLTKPYDPVALVEMLKGFGSGVQKAPE